MKFFLVVSMLVSNFSFSSVLLKKVTGTSEELSFDVFVEENAACNDKGNNVVATVVLDEMSMIMGRVSFSTQLDVNTLTFSPQTTELNFKPQIPLIQSSVVAVKFDDEMINVTCNSIRYNCDLE